MTKREIIHQVLNGTKPPYVPWSFSFTVEPHSILQRHFGDIPLETALDNHLLCLGNSVGFFKDLGANQFEDVFGVVELGVEGSPIYKAITEFCRVPHHYPNCL